MRHRDHGGFRDRGMADEGVFHVDGADPLAAGLDQILRAIGDFQITLAVDGRNVARVVPPVFRPSIAFLGLPVEATRHPSAAHVELSGRPAVPRHFALLADPTSHAPSISVVITAAGTVGLHKPIDWRLKSVSTDVRND
jgi:hypothetical protein